MEGQGVFKEVYSENNFGPACWEYEDSQAKIIVYYPRNELKILWEEPFT